LPRPQAPTSMPVAAIRPCVGHKKRSDRARAWRVYLCLTQEFACPASRKRPPRARPGRPMAIPCPADGRPPDRVPGIDMGLDVIHDDLDDPLPQFEESL
jgi:hypothetical protein